MTTKTHIEILVAPDCAAREQTRELVAQEVRICGIEARVEETVVATGDQAVECRFLGSPSVRINGQDVEPETRQRTEYGLG